jgi:hypothetical protein
MKLATFALALAILTPLTLTAQAPITHPDSDQATPSGPTVPPSNSVNVTFEGQVTTFSVADLFKLPQTTVQVHNPVTNTDESYSGPLLADVLAQAGLKPTRENEPIILHSSVVATATDHSFVLYSVAEVEPTYSTGQVIVAVMKSGLPDTEGGEIELINTLDSRTTRRVHGLADLNIISVAAGK